MSDNTGKKGVERDNDFVQPPINPPINKHNAVLEVPEKPQTPIHSDLGSGFPTPADAMEANWEYTTGVKLFAVLGVVSLTCFIMFLDVAIIATAGMGLATSFQGVLPHYYSMFIMELLSWAMLHGLCSCALQPLTGKIYARFSSKYTYMIFIALFELGSLICALANSSNVFIVGRAIAGIGGSGLINGSLTILSACLPLQKRAAYIGIMLSFSQIGVLIGPLIGGALTEYASWRWCFWINLPAGGVVVAILFFIQIPDRTKSTTIQENIKSAFLALDIPGFLLFAPTTIMCLLALQWGGVEYSWGSATIIGLFCGSAGLLLVFMAWEYREGDDAMIPWPMIKQKIVWASCLCMLFFSACQITGAYYLALYFQAVKGAEPTLGGVYLLPTIISNLMFSAISGILVGRLGYYLPWAVGGAVLLAISFGLQSTLTPSSSVGIWIGYQIIGGVGRGCTMPMPILALQNALPESRQSVAMALVSFAQSFGGALFLSFAQTGFNTGMKQGLRVHAPEISSEAVATAGAGGFRAIIPAASIPGVVEAYSESISHVFYIGTGTGVACFIFACGMGWKSIKKAKVSVPEA